jgi:hypothetical protein
MPRSKSTLAALLALSTLAMGAYSLGGLALERGEDETPTREMVRPWSLGGEADLSLPLDGGGRSSLAWSADRPFGLEARHELGDGVSLHVGAEALAGAGPLDPRAGEPAWQTGAAIRTKLDDSWTADLGVGWRNASVTATGFGEALGDAARPLDAAWNDGRGEGVVWLRLSASF